MRFTKSIVVLSLAMATTAFSVLAFGKKAATPTDKNAVAAITEMEIASVKADTNGDSSYVEKNYADNFSGGSSWGNWETKQSILADMKDKKNNKTNSEVISDLNVRIYGDTAIATYKSTYDSPLSRQPPRTNDSVDGHLCSPGRLVETVASHSSELGK